MSLLVRVRSLSTVPRLGVRLIHGPAPSQDEYTEVPHYPKILAHKNKDDLEQAKLVDLVKSLKTVEEKQAYINKPKYYGWYTCVIDAKKIRCGSLDFVQYVTNTTVVDGKLPELYGNVVSTEKVEEETPNAKTLPIDEEAQRIAKQVEPILKSFLVNANNHLEYNRDVENDKIPYHELHSRLPVEIGNFKVHKRERIQYIINGINRIILAHLRPNKPHLKDAVVDYKPRTEAFWFRGGILPDARMINKKMGRYNYGEKKRLDPEFAFPKEKVFEPYDRAIQTLGDTVLQIRCDEMLSPFIQNYLEDEICQQGHVPLWNYATQLSGNSHKFRNGTNLPGHWTGSPTGFVHLSFVNALNNYDNETNEAAWSTNSEYNDRASMLLSKAILGSFSVLLPSACYQGFSPLNDPTHPFCTQTVVSDGQNFKFTVNQLNKTALVDCDEEDKKISRNVCWHLPEQKLYESVDDIGVHGFDSKVLATLIKFYIAEPKIHEADIPNQGYLGPAKYVHNLKNTYNREYFSAFHRFQYSNRPRHMPKPEILPYQRIFMINHPEQMFLAGNREQPWFKMAQYDHLGRHHWHPEFHHADYFQSYKPKKFREHNRDFNKKKVMAPIPDEED